MKRPTWATVVGVLGLIVDIVLIVVVALGDKTEFRSLASATEAA